MSDKGVPEIRAEIFRLAKLSRSLEIMHWYIALDDCFENDEFHQSDEIENMKWRMMVLQDKHEPIGYLGSLIGRVLASRRMTI
jgi:hypothetical protein